MNTRTLLFLSYIGLSSAFGGGGNAGNNNTTVKAPYLNEDGSMNWDFFEILLGKTTLDQDTKAHWSTFEFRGIILVITWSLNHSYSRQGPEKNSLGPELGGGGQQKIVPTSDGGRGVHQKVRNTVKVG